ncbi:MAG TPA: LysR substrate-binding domain-containing protein [Polyangiales bacterium]|nr:LysR substrate-binding domain-containing protein [Polyangiales bacterium]
MHVSHLAGIDLNLLPLLDALLAERHLTRAARRVGLSQPAASRALGRLRLLLKDPLLVRTGAHFALTPRAESLRDPVRRAMSAVETAIAPPADFNPARAERVLRVHADDYTSLVVLTPLIAALSRSAPAIQIEVLPGHAGGLERLRRGEVDCCFTGAPHGNAPKGVDSDHLGDDGFVCMVSRRHAFARRAPNLQRFLGARHALVAPTGERGGFVDDALERMGSRRRVSLLLPHFLVMPFVIASSDLVVTLAERVARVYAGRLPVALFNPPLALPRFSIAAYWHERSMDDPAWVWVREQTRRANARGKRR